MCKINKTAKRTLCNVPIDDHCAMCYTIITERDSEHPTTNGSLSCDYEHPTAHKTGQGKRRK